MTAPRRAVVLLSGGLDSSTTLALAKKDGFECYALSFRYGQRHEVELRAARRTAERSGVADHVVMDINLRAFGGSALTDDIEVPKDRDDGGAADGIPVTYVPARNTIFLSFALGYAEVLGAEAIYTGVNAVDYSGYPDCRPEFIAAFQEMANLATKAGVEGHHVEVRAPLIKMTKAEIIKAGLELDVDYSVTSTCYAPGDSGAACGRCDACVLRRRGFADLGLEDPAPYMDASESNEGGSK